MSEYHVTFGASKKIVRCNSTVCKDIADEIRNSFSLDPNGSLHLQYWSEKFKDWVDCQEKDQVDEDSKLNVLNALDIQLVSSSFPAQPANLDVQLDSSSFPAEQQTSSLLDCENFPYLYKLPEFPLWVRTLLEQRSPQCKEAKCRRAVLDALFDDLLRYGHYPTSRMFQETSRALVETYPILKDRHFSNAKPHDSWVLRLRDKFKKFRSRHAELCNTEEMERMKAKYGKRREINSSKGETSLDNSLTTVKRVKVLEPSEYEEDQFSIDIHLKVLQEECQKRKPNDDLIRDKMIRTFSYRVSYITTHSVVETLTCFPPLKDANELLNEGMRMGINENFFKEFLNQKKLSLVQLAQTRKDKNVKVSNLLTSQAECPHTEDSELAFLALLLPCLMNEESPFLHAEETTDISVVKPVIVYRNSENIFQNSIFEIYLDTNYVTKADDILTSVTLWFTLFWVFDVGYTKDHLKYTSFLDTFVFKKCSLKVVPRSVKSFFNAL